MVIELTNEEVKALQLVFRAVGGDPKNSIRYITDGIFETLGKDYWEGTGSNNFTKPSFTSIRFKDSSLDDFYDRIKPKAVEMTIEEISNILGVKNLKIIKG